MQLCKSGVMKSSTIVTQNRLGFMENESRFWLKDLIVDSVTSIMSVESQPLTPARQHARRATKR